MNDLISRQEALQLVKDVCDAIMSCCGSHYDEETEDEVYDDIREVDAILKCNKEIRIALKNLPSAQPEHRWIPCSERLPEEYGNYLISIDGGEPDIGTINPNDPRGWSLCDANGFYWASDKALNITAWMPLPEPYKGEQE